MDTPVDTATSTSVKGLLAALVALGLVRGALRAGGLLALTGIVAATVGALTVGVLVLRIALG